MAVGSRGNGSAASGRLLRGLLADQAADPLVIEQRGRAVSSDEYCRPAAEYQRLRMIHLKAISATNSTVAVCGHVRILPW